MLNLNASTTYKIIAVVVAISIVAGGSFIGGRCSVKPDIKIVYRTEIKWKDRVVYRNYEQMSCQDIQRELLAYDTGKPRLDGIIEGQYLHATAGLHDREWSRDFKLKSGAGDSAKWYAVASVLSFVAGAICGGAVDYKAQEFLKK